MNKNIKNVVLKLNFLNKHMGREVRLMIQIWSRYSLQLIYFTIGNSYLRCFLIDIVQTQSFIGNILKLNTL